jgi:hypothetical protein
MVRGRTAMVLVQAMLLAAALSAYGLKASASAGDVAALIQLTVCAITHGEPEVLPPHVDEMSIVGDYAMTGFITGGGNSGGSVFFHKVNGKWRKIGEGGGYFYPSDLTKLYGIPKATAGTLVANQAPPAFVPIPTGKPKRCS